MEEMLSMLGEGLTPIIVNFVIILAGLLFSYLGKKAGEWFDALSKREKVKTMKDLADRNQELASLAVQFAEQVGKNLNLHGKEKYELAKEKLIDSANKEGLNIDNADINLLIESSLASFNNAFADARKPVDSDEPELKEEIVDDAGVKIYEGEQIYGYDSDIQDL